MSAHRHGDADGTEHQRDEAHEREQAGGAVKALRECGIGLAVVGDLRFRQELFETQLEVGDGLLGDGSAVARSRDLEEISLAGVAAGREQTAVGEALSRDEYARAGGEVAGEAVGLVGHDRGDAEDLAANGELVADLSDEDG